MDAPSRSAGTRRGRRNDPERRDRIIDACLDVLALHGVAGTSHRKVAAQAGVPLGAMTYYFDGMHELLHEAFTRFGTTISDRRPVTEVLVTYGTATLELAVYGLLVALLVPDAPLTEGLTIHRALDSHARDRREVEVAVHRVAHDPGSAVRS